MHKHTCVRQASVARVPAALLHEKNVLEIFVYKQLTSPAVYAYIEKGGSVDFTLGVSKFARSQVPRGTA